MRNQVYVSPLYLPSMTEMQEQGLKEGQECCLLFGDTPAVLNEFLSDHGSAFDIVTVDVREGRIPNVLLTGTQGMMAIAKGAIFLQDQEVFGTKTRTIRSVDSDEPITADAPDPDGPPMVDPTDDFQG